MVVHFIAIGGSVMHQLAIALKAKGYEVSGSDDEIFEPARSNLAAAGILPPEMGWFPDKISPRLQAIVLGMHAKADNPELLRAGELGIRIYSFPEYVFQESSQKTRIVVGGSHGKTTTTAMIMHVLGHAGRQFDYLVGAKLKGFGQSVHLSDANVIVCEGDEYPASNLDKRPKFHFLFPHIAVLTGIAWDHINVFPTFESYLDTFRAFIGKIEPGGLLIFNQTDHHLSVLAQQEGASGLRKIGYGVPVHSIADGKTSVEIEGHWTDLRVFGEHNLLNLQAAWLAVRELGISAETFIGAIRSFAGASKRLELLADNEQLLVFRDFAHAPSKVKATVAAVRQQFPKREIVAVLELHTYSSLNAEFMDQYAGSLLQADRSAVFYSKHALELKGMPELPLERIKNGFGDQHLSVFNQQEELIDWLNKLRCHNCVWLFMSSGDFEGLDLSQLAGNLIGSRDKS